jgi:lysophospholipase L1-like esterase
MLWPLLGLLVLGLWLFAPLSDASRLLQATAVAKEDNTLKLLVVGDSHVEGLGTYLSKGARLSRWGTYVYANRGKSTAWYANQTILRDLVHARQPNLILIVLGTNDIGQEDQPDVYRQKAQALLAQAGSTPVVWIGSPTIPRSQDEDNGAARRNEILAQIPGMTFVNARPMTSDLPRTPDQVHFTMTGYKRWAERIVEYLHLPIIQGSSYGKVAAVVLTLALGVFAYVKWGR